MIIIMIMIMLILIMIIITIIIIITMIVVVVVVIIIVTMIMIIIIMIKFGKVLACSFLSPKPLTLTPPGYQTTDNLQCRNLTPIPPSLLS